MRGIFVDRNSLKTNLTDLIKDGQNVILMPIFKSWADFVILNYVQTLQGLEVSYTYGN
jgi:hypothetical protein